MAGLKFNEAESASVPARLPPVETDVYAVLSRLNVDGSLDSTFADGGFYRSDFGGARLNAIALAADSKIVAAGLAESDYSVFRFGSNGMPDPAFSGDGLVSTEFLGRCNTARANAVAIQGDGKLVTGGSVALPGGPNGSQRAVALARYGAADAGAGEVGCERPKTKIKKAPKRLATTKRLAVAKFKFTSSELHSTFRCRVASRRRQARN